MAAKSPRGWLVEHQSDTAAINLRVWADFQREKKRYRENWEGSHDKNLRLEDRVTEEYATATDFFFSLREMLWCLSSPFIPWAQQRSLSGCSGDVKGLSLGSRALSLCSSHTWHAEIPTSERHSRNKGHANQTTKILTDLNHCHSPKYILHPQERTRNFLLQLIKSRVLHFLQHNYLPIVWSVCFPWHNQAYSGCFEFLPSFFEAHEFFSAAGVNSRCTAANSLLGMCFSYQPSTSRCLKLPLLLVWQFISLSFAFLGSEFGSEPWELTLGWDTEFKFVNLTRTAL